VEAAVRALAEPRRREILHLVRDDELSAGEIASHFDVSRPAISQHLGVLKDAGLLDERRDGTRRLYRVRPEGFAELREFLDEFWGEGLARLKSAAEADHRAQRTQRAERRGGPRGRQ
jgi:DNA-binding transcriptional ArsR family regulator